MKRDRSVASGSTIEGGGAILIFPRVSQEPGAVHRQHPPEDRCASYNDGLVLSEYTPMAPTLVRDAFHREGWVYEEKVDGWRILAYKDGDRVRLISRNGRDHTRRFAGIAAAVAKLSARALVLDGEVAIY